MIRFSVAIALILGAGLFARLALSAARPEAVDPPVRVSEVGRAFGDESWPIPEPATGQNVDQLESLGSPRYFGGSDDFGRIVSLRDVDGYLFVGDELGDPHVAVIRLSTGKLVENFARHGNSWKGSALATGHGHPVGAGREAFRCETACCSSSDAHTNQHRGREARWRERSRE